MAETRTQTMPHSDCMVRTAIYKVRRDMVSCPLSLQFLFPFAMQIPILFRCHPSPPSLWIPQEANSIPVTGMNSRLMIISPFCQWSIQERACDLNLANVIWKEDICSSGWTLITIPCFDMNDFISDGLQLKLKACGWCFHRYTRGHRAELQYPYTSH